MTKKKCLSLPGRLLRVALLRQRNTSRETTHIRATRAEGENIVAEPFEAFLVFRAAGENKMRLIY